MRIHKLSTELINHIAAGEIIERPVSVVKELIENCLDAQAKTINIDIEHGGIHTICIRDDGIGIAKEDLSLAVSRYATSKIQCLDDLEQLTSMGFRGEALASIQNVARFSLTSKIQTSAYAWKLTKNRQQQNFEYQPTPHPQGTTVEVNNLFYNLPARRKFLKSAATEFTHIEKLVKHIALMHMHIGFNLRHNQKIIFNLPAAISDLDSERRWQTLYGNNILQQSIKLDYANNGLKISGWLGIKPTSKTTHAMFVNQRLIKDRALANIIQRAYQTVFLFRKSPNWIISLSLYANLLDVNAHPTKQCLRFREPELIQEFLLHAISKTLTAYQNQIATKIQQQQSHTAYLIQAPATDLIVSEPEVSYNFSLGKALAYLHARYILTESANKLLLVDTQAAIQHLNYTQLKLEYQQQTLQTTSVSVVLSLNITSHEAEILSTFGFETNQITTDTLVLHTIPIGLESATFETLIQELLEILRKHTLKAATALVLHHITTYIPQVNPTKLSLTKMNQFLRKIESLHTKNNPQTLWKVLSAQDLNSFFNHNHA